MESQKTSSQKLSEGIGKLGGAMSGLGGTATKLAGIIGISLTMDTMAKSAASYGKTLFDLSQTAKTSGADFGKLKKAVEDISKTTTLSKQESAKLVLSWQKGIDGTKRSADEITKFTKAMSLTGQSYEEIQSQANDLMKIQNDGIDVISKLNSSYQDKAAVEGYIDTLISAGQISTATGQSLSLLADKMREGSNSADDQQFVGFHTALIMLQKAGTELALTFGERLAPMMMKLVGVATDVTQFLATAPNWAIYAGVAVPAIGAILTALAALAPLVAPLVAVVGGPLLLLGAGLAGVGGYMYKLHNDTMSANDSVATLAKTTEDAKKRMAASGNQISGFEVEESEIAALKAKQAANVVAKAYSSTLAAEIDAKQKELTERMQAAFAKNIADGKKGPGTGVIQDKSGEKVLDTASKIRQELAKQSKEAEALAKLIDMQAGAEQKRMNFLLQYKNDIKGVEQSADAITALYGRQLDQLKNLLAVTEEQEKLGGESAVAAQQKKVQILGQIADIESKSVDIGVAKINSSKTEIENREKQLGLLEAEMNLQKSIFTGLGPQLDTLSKMNDELEGIIRLEQNAANEAKKKFDETGMNSYMQQYLDHQSKATQAAQKQIDLTKNLREGYLDAMGAFTNVTGSMAKIITTQQMGVGEMLRTVGQSGSLRGGGIGGGLTNPYAKFKQGGQLETGSRAELDNLMDKRGIGKGKPMVTAATAMSGMSQGQKDALTSGTEKTGINTGGSKAPSTPNMITNAGGSGPNPNVSANASAAGGSGPNPNVSANASAAGDPMVLLNQNMSKYVAEGIKMAGGMGGQKPIKKGYSPSFEKAKTDPASPFYDPDFAKNHGTTTGSSAGAAGDKGTAGPAGTAGSDDAKAKDVSEGGKPPADFIKEHDAAKADYDQQHKENIAREEAERRAIALSLRNNPVKFQSNVGIGDSGYRGGVAGGGKGRGVKGGAGAKGTKGRSGEMDTEGLAEASRINSLTNDRKKYLSDVGEQIKGKGERGQYDYKSRVAGQQQALFKKYQQMGGKDMSSTGGVFQAMKNSGKQESKVMGNAMSDYDKKQYGMDDMKKIATNTQKSAKEAEKTNKTMDKAREENRQQASDSRSEAASMASNFQGMGGANPTDFGMGAALGMGSGDNFGAGMFGMADGGTVPGVGTGDTQPAMLTPGETVIKKDVSRKFGPLLSALNKNKYAMGGVVGSAPLGGAMMGGGGAPSISLNVRGDSIDKIMKSVTNQLSTQLNRMMAPHGSTGRQFELSQ